MSFDILPYTFDNFKSCLTAQATSCEAAIHQKQHLSCFQNYFSHIGVKTIVVEKEYVNRDFLEDYSSYYVRSFKQYDRFCVRLHFFKVAFDSDEFSEILRGTPKNLKTEDLQLNYQGFMVLKPLPITVIGTTCLATYEHDNKRYFPCVRKYNASLFGIKLEVNSLAYQEQDSIVAACASSSIWTVFHRTAVIFQHSLPSPVEITKWATKYFPFANRHFPNKGLTGEQMSIAIREVGLEPYLYDVTTYDRVKATAYAYLKGGIPLVLGFQLWNTENVNAEPFGGHAVTITGYSVDDDASTTFDEIPNLTLTSSRISKFYVHDDQIGPFAKMDFCNNKIIYNGRLYPCIETSWFDSKRKTGNIKGTPDILIIPLYHKIRIPFESVLISVNMFNSIIQPFVAILPNFKLFEWDIFLSEVSDFKESIFPLKGMDYEIKKSILVKRLPKYVWRAIGYIGTEKKIEFLFDATDIEQGSFYLMTVAHDDISNQQFKILFSQYDTNSLSDLTTKEIIESFQN
jgi:hypothetical protein